ncbi:hypothetical protein HAALTHF_45330n [Vreelandella aquamarina]|nr:hypothetical protein HAALTHF_45330n [Halomonas axialensis]
MAPSLAWRLLHDNGVDDYSPALLFRPFGTVCQTQATPGAVLLDSGRPKATTGRYDILSSDPLATLKISPDGHTAFESDTLTLPPSLMGNSHAQQQWLLEQLPTANLKSELPF